MSERLIYHIFADEGVESEVLSAYGRVVRVGLDPIDTNQSEPIQADATEIPLKPGADLAVLHPPCQRWSSLTPIHGDPLDHPNLIPDARRLGKELADHYIIENVPNAPLDNPTVLDGRMFGLPIRYERAFETSFHVKQPPRYTTLETNSERVGRWQGPIEWWRSVKGYSGDYSRDALLHSGIPAPYIQYLIRAWVEDGLGLDSQPLTKKRGESSQPLIAFNDQ